MESIHPSIESPSPSTNSSSPANPNPPPKIKTGHVNLAYLYQKPMFAVLPNEAMGNFDLCRHAELYTPNHLVQAHYCALSHDRGGVCVPTACEAEDLHDRAILQPLMNLGIQAATTVRAFMGVVVVRMCVCLCL
jgi:hypothetical protein